MRLLQIAPPHIYLDIHMNWSFDRVAGRADRDWRLYLRRRYSTRRHVPRGSGPNNCPQAARAAQPPCRARTQRRRGGG